MPVNMCTSIKLIFQLPRSVLPSHNRSASNVVRVIITVPLMLTSEVLCECLPGPFRVSGLKDSIEKAGNILPEIYAGCAMRAIHAVITGC